MGIKFRQHRQMHSQQITQHMQHYSGQQPTILLSSELYVMSSVFPYLLNRSFCPWEVLFSEYWGFDDSLSRAAEEWYPPVL